jgi:catechol 2,3-dioxygenase
MKIHELGHVVLYVTSLSKMADFYRDTLGFREIVREWPIAAFSSGRTHHELLLIEVGGVSSHSPQPKPGLYHIGFKIADDDAELKQALEELKGKGVQIVGLSDHTVTHSLYILDPDGNELELYADVSDAWKTNPSLIAAPVRPLKLD